MTQAKTSDRITIATAIVSHNNREQALKRVVRNGADKVNRRPLNAPASPDQLNKLLDKFAK